MKLPFFSPLVSTMCHLRELREVAVRGVKNWGKKSRKYQNEQERELVEHDI